AIDAAHGDMAAAVADYEQIIKEHPNLPFALKRLAAVYAQNDANLEKARDVALKARKNLPDDLELARTLGEISYRRKEYSMALQMFQEIARKQPLDANSLYYL